VTDFDGVLCVTAPSAEQSVLLSIDQDHTDAVEEHAVIEDHGTVYERVEVNLPHLVMHDVSNYAVYDIRKEQITILHQWMVRIGQALGFEDFAVFITHAPTNGGAGTLYADFRLSRTDDKVLWSILFDGLDNTRTGYIFFRELTAHLGHNV
jgi:hypothetical protein